ncbi:hypothetical protein [Staphylococcus epidermidis]|uniref:hypothetical protein n=1 Tax=Staphylococcus epidermidis TaxID=1282 RepID=UPI0001A963BE|nr:hypothetical protein [Staphylococcus epidermidis]EES35708.1 hypothetical protein HMPREF0791_1670 [Staphylococcus epidermidis W23144]EJE05918.1 hypothetical protein HMPREF9983_04706 [Staphylococcus epidermidis NIHLM023]MBF2224463.1 hypothetical protein [Staphylococcus epidermidis]MBF2283610.1 hypothetical protein [Staphylococcus epidermidis]MBF2289649.1 hypothetical protein [Staphylococcus epidermidis]
MATVTQRVKQVKQPRGGYFNRKAFVMTQLEPSEFIDTTNENVPPQTVGLVVDYLTRMIVNQDAEKAFAISLMGAELYGDLQHAQSLLAEIKGNDDVSIIKACQLVNYDMVYRIGGTPKPPVIPDKDTVKHIQLLVDRSLAFFNETSEITADGFTFEGGYTNMINAGDGDFLTTDTLWDFKVSKQLPQKNQTLQLAIYYLMGKASQQSIFKNIRYIGIFNPRLNRIYTYDMTQADSDILEIIRKEVIGYD